MPVGLWLGSPRHMLSVLLILATLMRTGGPVQATHG